MQLAEQFKTVSLTLIKLPSRPLLQPQLNTSATKYISHKHLTVFQNVH